MKPIRMKMAHQLIVGYGLYRKMDVYEPHIASVNELTKFHSHEYIEYMENISKTETKKQLIVCRHDRMQCPLKLSSGFCCELAFVCPGRWSLRLAPLTVNALGLSTPSSYGWTLRR